MSESGFNRDQYAQGASVQSLKAVNEDAEKHNKKFYEDQNFVGFHEIKEGINIFRIATAHDPKNSPYIPVRSSRLDVEVDEYDQQNNKTGNKTWRKRKCYIATQHGPRDSRGTSLITEDVIEYYIQYFTKKLKDEGLSEQDKEKRLAPIHGFWHQGKYQWGIRPESKYICYAWDTQNEIKQLELSKRWYGEMESLIIEASASMDVAVDIFSHIDNGIPLIIEKIVHKEAGKKNKTEYKIRKDGPDMARRESWNDFFERTRITDQQLASLLEKKSLNDMYRENYTYFDFERALVGLRRFDAAWKNDLFKDDEFVKGVADIEATLKKLLPEKADDEEVTADMTTLEMYDFIVKYVSTVYDGKYEVPELSNDATRALFRLAMNDLTIPTDSLILSSAKTLKPKQNHLPPNDLPFDTTDATNKK